MARVQSQLATMELSLRERGIVPGSRGSRPPDDF